MKSLFSVWYPPMVPVAPLVGAWIEIGYNFGQGIDDKVAPLVGAWIEIATANGARINILVAPLVGAWIEMAIVELDSGAELSLPLWERGLKWTCEYR